MRGILPKELGHWRQPQRWADQLDTFLTSDFARTAAELEVLATDGSGGPAYQAHCRRVTAAVAAVQFEDSEARNIQRADFLATSVPGKQTVPRAELFGLIKAAEFTSTTHPTDILCDSAYAVRGAQAFSKDKLLDSFNGDLWEQYGEVAHGRVQVRKVRAHAEQQVLTGSIGIDEYLRNAVADAAADAVVNCLTDVMADLIVESMIIAVETRFQAYNDQVTRSNQMKAHFQTYKNCASTR